MNDSIALIPPCDIDVSHGWAVTKVITDTGPNDLDVVHLCDDCHVGLTSDPAHAASAWALIPICHPL